MIPYSLVVAKDGPVQVQSFVNVEPKEWYDIQTIEVHTDMLVGFNKQSKNIKSF